LVLRAHYVEVATIAEKTVPSQKTRKADTESEADKVKPKEKATVSAPKVKPSAKPKAKAAAKPVTKGKSEAKPKAKPAAKPKAKVAPKGKPKVQAKAKPKAKRPVPTKAKAPAAPKIPAAPQPPPQEVASGIIISYQRGPLRPRLLYGLIRLAGVTTEEKAAAFVGHRIILRVSDRVSVGGRVIGPHGGNGVLRVRFHRGIAPDALAKEVKVF
jgi:ribosomal protein L35AE/L33A